MLLRYNEPLKKEDHIMFKLLYKFLLSIPTTLFSGYVFSRMWEWFILRKFSNMPSMSMLDAVGIIMVVTFPFLGLFLHHTKQEFRKENANLGDVAIDLIFWSVMMFVVYPLTLATAFVWSRVIG